jgi:hypothetical protein
MRRGENSLSVDHTRKIMFFKGKTKTDTVDYQIIEKLEIKNYLSKGDLISAIIIGIISLITLQLWGLLIVAFLIAFSYGKNVLIIKKDSSVVCLQIGGPLSGGIGQKEEIDKFVAMLKEKTGRQLL